VQGLYIQIFNFRSVCMMWAETDEHSSDIQRTGGTRWSNWLRHCGFDSRWRHSGKGGRCVKMTTLPPSCADCLEIWEPQPPGTFRACTGIVYLYLYQRLREFWVLVSLSTYLSTKTVGVCMICCYKKAFGAVLVISVEFGDFSSDVSAV